jgi:tripartite-type tricarboxylate transporter receptor subunit TctC
VCVDFQSTFQERMMARCCSPAVAVFAVAVLGALSAAPVVAQTVGRDFPSRPIRMIVPFVAGGTSDTIARVVGQKLTEAWNQPVISDLRPGAGGSLGTEIAAAAQPDGYTILVGNIGPISTNPLLLKVKYDSQRDFAPISLVARAPQLLVINPSIPANSMNELVAFIRSQGGKVNYGSSGTGSIAHLAAELFRFRTGVEMVHVPYKAVTPALADTVGGSIQLIFSDMGPALAQVRAGRLRAIATTGPKPTAFLPDTPTANQTFKGFEMVSWWGLLAPARTPATIVNRFNAEVVRALQAPEVRERLSGLGVESVSSTPQEMAAIIRSDQETFAKLIKSANISAD